MHECWNAGMLECQNAGMPGIRMPMPECQNNAVGGGNERCYLNLAIQLSG